MQVTRGLSFGIETRASAWAHGTSTRLDAVGAPPNGAHALDGIRAPGDTDLSPEGFRAPEGTDTSPDGAVGHPNGQAAGHREPGPGHIWLCKLGWWVQAPWDVRAYAAGHPTYPCDSTLQQLYDGAEFEAYRELGTSAVAAAADDGGLPR